MNNPKQFIEDLQNIDIKTLKPELMEKIKNEDWSNAANVSWAASKTGDYLKTLSSIHEVHTKLGAESPLKVEEEKSAEIPAEATSPEESKTEKSEPTPKPEENAPEPFKDDKEPVAEVHAEESKAQPISPVKEA